MINFRAGVFGRTIQKLRQIVVLLSYASFDFPNRQSVEFIFAINRFASGIK
jgi:hypothetical protein